MTTDTPPEDLPSRSKRRSPGERAYVAVRDLNFSELDRFVAMLVASDHRVADHLRRTLADALGETE